MRADEHRHHAAEKVEELSARVVTLEAAAQSRVHRAVGKLHRYFNQRSVSFTTAIIAGAISAHAIHAAPVALAKR